MLAIEKMAVAKAFATKEITAARAEVDPGVYEIDEVVRVTGTIKVGEDYEQEFWQIAKPEKTVLAFACAVNKTTAALITQEQYDRAMTEVEGLVAEVTDAEAKRFKDDRAATLKKLRKPTLQTAKGKVTTKLKVEQLEAVA